MLKIKETPSKVTETKKTISVTDALVDSLVIFDETGDISDEIRDAIPPYIDKVSFKITITLDDEE